MWNTIKEGIRGLIRKGMEELPNWNDPVIEEISENIATDEVIETTEESSNKANIPLFIIPVNNYKVTSGYGNRTLTYEGVKHKSFHYGVDLVGPSDEVIAPEDCVIKKIIKPDLSNPCKFKWTKAGWMKITPPIGKTWDDGSWGWTPYFSAIGVHTKTMYIFRHSICAFNVGEEVKVGLKIGRWANLGFSMGAHCHFEVYPYSEKIAKDSHWPYTVDPMKFKV